ncbi:MAG: response regulator [Gammaproteobacteria bacterium]|nr:response regulator [Gammaproteobacteria bacterium]
MLLEPLGHVVHVVHDGPRAIEAAQEYRPHALLLDIGLPKIDGYGVAKRLRANEAFQNSVDEVTDSLVGDAGFEPATPAV